MDTKLALVMEWCPRRWWGWTQAGVGAGDGGAQWCSLGDQVRCDGCLALVTYADQSNHKRATTGTAPTPKKSNTTNHSHSTNGHLLPSPRQRGPSLLVEAETTRVGAGEESGSCGVRLACFSVAAGKKRYTSSSVCMRAHSLAKTEWSRAVFMHHAI